MRVDFFDFLGLDEALQGIRALSPEVGYFLLYDTSVPKQEIRLDRLDFEPSRIAAFMAEPSATETSDDEDGVDLDSAYLQDVDSDDEAEDGDGDDENDEPRSNSPAPSPGPRHFGETGGLDFNHVAMLEGVCNWLTRSGIRLGHTAKAIKLRVQAITSKGGRVLFTASFWVHNTRFRQDLEEMARIAGLERLANSATVQSTPASGGAAFGPAVNTGGQVNPDAQPAAPPAPTTTIVPAPRVIAPTPMAVQPVPQSSVPPPDMLIYPAGYQDGTLFGTVGAFRALNESYVQFGQALTTGVSSLQTMMNQMLEARGEELVQSRGHVNQLVNDVLDHRIREVEARTDAQQVQVADHRTALMRDAVNQMGETARVIFTNRGMSPELADVMGQLSGNPDLMNALQQPDVRELLKDPTAQKALTEMLLQAGQMAKAGSADGQVSRAQLPAPQPLAPQPAAALQPQATLYNTSMGTQPPALPSYPAGPYPHGYAGGFPPHQQAGGFPPGTGHQPPAPGTGTMPVFQQGQGQAPQWYPPPSTQLPPGAQGYPPGYPPGSAPGWAPAPQMSQHYPGYPQAQPSPMWQQMPPTNPSAPMARVYSAPPWPNPAEQPTAQVAAAPATGSSQPGFPSGGHPSGSHPPGASSPQQQTWPSGEGQNPQAQGVQARPPDVPDSGRTT